MAISALNRDEATGLPDSVWLVSVGLTASRHACYEKVSGLRSGNSFKSIPSCGIDYVLYATLVHVCGSATGRLNSGVMRNNRGVVS